ncbi:MAG: aminoglycoside phosphotransferase family protein [bacterium]|nr:aminoglycoside phosphotransferase family protein [bacterium]
MNLTNVVAQRAHKTIYRDGNLMIKVFDDTYSKADALQEAMNTALVEETGLNIPRLHGVTMIDGKWAVMNDFIEGKTLQQMIDDDPEHTTEYLDRMIDLQMEMLRKTCPRLPDLTEKMQKRISASGLEATQRYDLHTRLAAMHGHHKLCHGDFNPSNIVITEDGEAFILDWNHATQGNASADVARSYLLFWIDGRPDLADLYLDMYCKKSDTAKQYVQKWIPIVAASQLASTNSPEVKQLLLRWADVVEYV